MFYLKEFFKSLGESLFRGFFFFLFSCLLAMGLTHRAWITKALAQITPEKMVNPYFVVVVDEEPTAANIRHVMDKLPGILSINDTGAEGQRKLSALVGELGSGYEMNSALMDFKSFRIVLSPSLSAESLEFVREQVVKTGGKDHVTASAIKFPEVTAVMKAHPFYAFLSKFGDWGVIGILALLWIVSYWLCYDVFRSRSYIIEKFQRKKLVAAKTLASGLSLIVLLFGGLGILDGTLKFFDYVLLFMVFSVFWTFSMQDWRWKPTL